MMYECCGKCKYHNYNRELGEWVCDNPDSEYYGVETFYDDGCREQEEKE